MIKVDARQHKAQYKPGTVVHVYNPRYLGGSDQEDHNSRLAQAKSLQDSILTNGWAQWYMPVIPAMQESQIGRLQSRPAPS
jgi:hypothetical protein